VPEIHGFGTFADGAMIAGAEATLLVAA